MPSRARKPSHVDSTPIEEAATHTALAENDEYIADNYVYIGRRLLSELPKWGEILGVIALLAVPIFSLRALVVSMFDLDVAYALVQFTSLSTFATTTLVGITLYGLQILGWIGGYKSSELASRVSLTWSKKRYAFSGVTILLAVMVLGSYAKSAARISYFLLTVNIMYLVWSAAVNQGMWLPAEHATVEGKQQTIYTLQDSGTSIVVFLPSSSSVRRVESSKIEGRQYCLRKGVRSVADYYIGDRQMPICP